MPQLEGGLSLDSAVDKLVEEEIALFESTSGETPAETPAVPASPAADDADPSGAAPTPADPTTDAPPQTASVPDPAAAATTPTSAPAWGFSADGVKVTVPGASLTANGMLMIPKAAWDRTVQPHLANRAQWNQQVEQFRRTESTLRQQVEQIERGEHPEIVRAKAITAKFTELLDAGPEKMAEWLDNFAVNRPVLEAEARAKAAELERDQFRQRQAAAQQEAQTAALEPQKRAAVEQHVAALVQTPDLKELGLDSGRLVTRLLRNPGVFVTADRDYPEVGLRKGELAVNLELLRSEVEDAADQMRTWRAQQQAAAQNQKAQAGAALPPATPVRGSPAPGGKTPDKPKNWSEFQDQFMEL